MKGTFTSLIGFALAATTLIGCGDGSSLATGPVSTDPTTYAGESASVITGRSNGLIANTSTTGPAGVQDPNVLGFVQIDEPADTPDSKFRHILGVTNQTRILKGGEEVPFESLKFGQRVSVEFIDQSNDIGADIDDIETALEIQILD